MYLSRAVAATAAGFAALCLAAPAAQAAESTMLTPAANSASLACGYNDSGPPPIYRHCTSNPNYNVMIHVDGLWGNDFKQCVAPGDTPLSTIYSNGWRITGAYYISGNDYCTPGVYGSD